MDDLSPRFLRRATIALEIALVSMLVIDPAAREGLALAAILWSMVTIGIAGWYVSRETPRHNRGVH